MHADGSDRSSYSSRNVAADQNQILNGHGNERGGVIYGRRISEVDDYFVYIHFWGKDPSF